MTDYINDRAVFRARFDGEICGKCSQMISKDDLICSNGAGGWMHVGDCEPDSAADGKAISWDVAGDSIERMNRRDEEEEQVAPLARPVCPGCFCELPKSLICGVC